MDVSNSTLAITYKDDGNQDGICSQLLRIYGVYAISRFLKVPYFHSPIAHLGYHGLAALENDAPIPDLRDDVNRAFDIPSDVQLAGRRVIVHDMVDVDIEAIKKIGSAGSAERGLDLIRILYPFPFTDSNPEVYRYLKTVCPFPYRRSKVFRLAIHVRRGELFAVYSDWMLPNSYYVSCVLKFQAALRKLDIPFVCELYTEVPSKAFEVTPHHHGIHGGIAENVIFDPANNHLEDFDAIPNLERFVNFDPIESQRRMTTADALIISHSSFSYLPAVFNPNCIVIYNPYWRGRMKNWLVSDNNGSFPESDLINRLKEWKRLAELDSAASLSRIIGAPPGEDVPPGILDPEIDRLLEPFRSQSASIRSIVNLGVRTIVDDTSEHSQGDDLHVFPAHQLSETISPPPEDFSLRAVAALYPATSGRPSETWRLRRSLFDLGLICIGSVDFANGKALCFLSSDAIRSFNQLDVEPRGHVSMSSLLDGAGLANQLWRYAWIKLYALRHGLTPAFPAWQGNRLFGLHDQSSEGFSSLGIAYPGFANDDRELWDSDDPPINLDLKGYFQEIPECWRKHRAFLSHMFQLPPAQVQDMDAWKDSVTEGGRRTLVAISVRRGDYCNFQVESLPWFRIVPEEWYLEWLRKIWPTLPDPVLFVASDEPEKITPLFQEFNPISSSFEGAARQLPHHISDFEVLRRADYVAICNSSFPRFAAILAPATQQCFLPSFETQSFEPYQPWMDPAFWPRFADAWQHIKPPDAKQPTLYFEVSGLLLSLLHHNSLSGIQRVQWEILSNVPDFSFAVLRPGGGLGTIDTKALLDVVQRIRRGAISRDALELQVLGLLHAAEGRTARARDIFLATGAYWNVSGIGALLQSVKNAGAKIGVWIHDILPLTAPEFFDPALKRQFANGLDQSLSFADFILTDSEYNKVSLTKQLGSASDALPVHVVPVGGAFPRSEPVESNASDYVLCAGTIEGRKNPSYLFNIWKMMIGSGRPNIPRLVFAGRKGWLAEDFIRQLEACNYLDGRIQCVHDSTDLELDALYRSCMLTVFPSFLEASAPEVNESLAHGKICLCSDEGGIPEAGGHLVDYVDPYNVRDGLQKLVRYLDHPELRRTRELEIAANFTPGTWAQAADGFLVSVQTLASQVRPFDGVGAVTLPPDRYMSIGSEAPAAAPTDLVCVSGWYAPGIEGVRPSQSPAMIRFRTAAPVGTRINLILRLAAHGRDFRIGIFTGSCTRTEVYLTAGSTKLAVLPAMVERGRLVATFLQTIDAPVGSDGPYWSLRGLLYFDPKGAKTVHE